MVDSLDVFVTPQKNSPPGTPAKASKEANLIANVDLLSDAGAGRACTALADGEGALVAGVDLTGSASGEIKELDESRDHLVLLFGVAQSSITPEAPAEDTLLGVQHQLHTQPAVY